MDANNWRPTAPGGEPAMDTGDWRTQLQPDSRQRIVNKIMETLKKHLPFSGQEGLQELKKIAIRFEEKIYTAATSQSDYLRKISLKMLTMETKSQNTMPNSLPSNSTGNGNKPLDSGAPHSMQPQVHNQVQSLPIPMSANQHQARQQLLSQNLQNNIASNGVQSSVGLPSAMPPVSGINQTIPSAVSGLTQTIPNAVGQNPNMQSISGVSHNAMGNSRGQGMPSNIFANSQRPILDLSSTSLDSTAQTGHANGGDWQEEVFQKIQVMKETYYPELNEIYQKIATKLEQHDSLPQQPKSEQLDKLKIFKTILDRIITFLQVSKSNISPHFKEKLGSYEKHIINFLNSNRPRMPIPSLLEGQLPQSHMQSMQQPQFQIPELQSHENQMNPQMQSMNRQVSVPMMQQNNMSKPQHNSVSSLSGLSNSQQAMMSPMQSVSNLDFGQGNALGSMPQTTVGSIQQNPMNTSQLANINTMSTQSGVNMLQPNLPLQSNSNMSQHQHLKQQREQKMLRSQQLKQIQWRQMQQQQLMQKQQMLQQQFLGAQSGNSSLPTNQQPVHMLQQPKIPLQQQAQQSASSLLPNQGQQSQPQQQSMSQIQSQLELQQQMGLQQQSNSLQCDLQQRLEASGALLQPQNVIDQQKHLCQSQRALPQMSSTSLDSTAQTGHANGGDWQEEVFQKIQVMKETYYPELNEMYQKIATKLEQHDSLPQQPKSEQLDKLKIFKTMLDRIITFLQVSKSNISPHVKEKLGSYEKQIINFLNTSRPRRPIPSLQQGQLPLSHMQSMPQPQSQIPQLQSHEDQMNPQMQSTNLQGFVPTMQQNNMSSPQHNSVSSLSGLSNSQQTMMNPMQSGSNLDFGQGNALGSMRQTTVGSIQQNPMNTSQQANINTMSTQSGANMLQPNLPLESNSNMIQHQHLKQQREQQMLQSLQLKQIQQCQMQQKQLMQKQQMLQQQFLGAQSSNSSLQTNQHPVHMLQQPKIPLQQQAQQSASSLLPNQGQQSQPQRQSMLQIVIDQQKQLYQPQRALPETSSSTLILLCSFLALLWLCFRSFVLSCDTHFSI